MENNIYNVNNDNEYYTLKDDVQTICDHINLPKDKVIWCPFDLDESNFVKVFKEQGYKVINSHIWTGQNFYEFEPNEKGDIIVSNPPFKDKENVIKRLKEFNKPFCLIFGIQCFSSGGFIKELSYFKNLQMTFFQMRMKFVKDLNNIPKKLPSPTFHSMLIMNDCLKGKHSNISIIEKGEIK